MVHIAISENDENPTALSWPVSSPWAVLPIESACEQLMHITQE